MTALDFTANSRSRPGEGQIRLTCSPGIASLCAAVLPGQSKKSVPQTHADGQWHITQTVG
jgi:hypothetical protein